MLFFAGGPMKTLHFNKRQNDNNADDVTVSYCAISFVSDSFRVNLKFFCLFTTRAIQR